MKNYCEFFDWKGYLNCIASESKNQQNFLQLREALQKINKIIMGIVDIGTKIIETG